MKLNNKVIIVTGASSGIGKATAIKLAKNGASVVLTSRSEDKLEEIKETIEKNNGKALVVTCDVTSKDDFSKLVEKTIQEFGTVNAIINNAGLMPLSYIEKFKTDEWETMVDVNIKGVLNGIAAVLPTLIENKGGNIINISSTAAYNYFPGGAVYCATKSAVKMFSEGLRKEITPKYGINVTSIEPGAVNTDLLSTITDEDIKEELKQMKEMTSLEAEDIADAIFYTLTQPERVNVNDVHILPSEQK
ncbi:SDR family oxidoreductase [Polaribacter sp. KT 15]|uniref:SDR family oxidoreductase n=1 Tax=Polaribacter sp. KT 15 TaxID=1896175 RepID=UPI00090A20E6|nr:SDR family oxidoreductase [Polaribacter sp. KT 15]SHN02656.1 NADP-dependent 3-hydroxy acid dehydrogenase YdfG [Polaribacter sp. KT 15]